MRPALLLGQDAQYTNRTDPNTIRFFISLTNLYVNGPAQLELNLEAGVPSGVAVLVDNTNLAAAVWTAYNSSNLAVDLGSAEGWHQVRVGLRGRMAASEQTWERRRIKLDLTPPSLAVTNPTSSVLSQPLIQLKGYSPEPLQRISYDLVNASGELTDQQVLLLDQYCDTNLWEVTTHYYQAFDLALTNGINSITLHATDLAGNTAVTNFSFTLDYSNDTNPPAISLYWPRNGMQVSGSNITWRGFVDDATAVVTVSVTDANGVTNSANAIVEREGKVWVEDLLLSDGTNLLTLTATDAARNVAVTNITVINLLGALTIDPVSEYQLTNATLELVSGTISLNDYTVWVNGTRATQTNGTWLATNVMLAPGATAIIQAMAIPNSDNGGNGTGGGGGTGGAGASGSTQNPESPGGFGAEWQKDRTSSACVFLASYKGHFNSTESLRLDSYSATVVSAQSTDYRDPLDSEDCGGGSLWYEQSAEDVDWWWHYLERYHYSWPREPGLTTLFINVDYSGPGTNFSGSGTQDVGRNDALQDIPPTGHMEPTQWQEEGSESEPPREYEFSRSVTSQVKLWTGGKNVAGREGLFKLRASATAWRQALIPDPYDDYTDWVGTDVPAFLPIGEPGSNGWVWAKLPDGIAQNVTPIVAGTDKCTFEVQAEKIVVSLVSLVPNDGHRINGSSPPTYRVGTCGDDVIVTATPDPPVTEDLLPSSWTFTGGTAVGKGKLQRKVEKASLLNGPCTFTATDGVTNMTVIMTQDPSAMGLWHEIYTTADCDPGLGTNAASDRLTDLCGNVLQINCENGTYVYRYNGTAIGQCCYSTATNCFWYQTTKDGSRFHSTWQLTRSNYPWPAPISWKVFHFDCVNRTGDALQCTNYRGPCMSFPASWCDPNNNPNADNATCP